MSSQSRGRGVSGARLNGELPLDPYGLEGTVELRIEVQPGHWPGRANS